MSIFGKQTPFGFMAILQNVRTFLMPKVDTSITRYIRRDSDVKCGHHVKHYNRVRQLMNLRTNRMTAIHSKLEAFRDERKSNIKAEQEEYLSNAHFDRMAGSLGGSLDNFQGQGLTEFEFDYKNSLFFDALPVKRPRNKYINTKTELTDDESWAIGYLHKLLSIIGLRKA